MKRAAIRALGAGALMIALAAVVAGGVAAKPGSPGPGSPPSVKSCQNDGWQNLVRDDGTAFASERECTRYAANGGVLQPKTTPSAQSLCEAADGTFTSGGTVFGDEFGEPALWTCAAFLGSTLQLRDRCTADGGSGASSIGVSPDRSTLSCRV